jgi:hypothetical protein
VTLTVEAGQTRWPVMLPCAKIMAGSHSSTGREGRSMGFMDKVKEQAAAATAVAKDTAQKGQAKVDEVQAKRNADEVLRQLGLAVYLERTGRGTDSSESAIGQRIEALKAYEEEHGELQAPEEAPGDSQ